MEKIKSEEIVKEVYVSESEGSNMRGRPLGKWRDKIKEYKCEGGRQETDRQTDRQTEGMTVRKTGKRTR